MLVGAVTHAVIMEMYLFLHLISYLSFVSSSYLPSHLPFLQTKKLLIDKLSYKNSLKNERNHNLIIVYDISRIRNKRALRKIYEIVETGDLSLSNEHLMRKVYEIFEKNRFYCYSPAEWAILQDRLQVLDHFIDESLLKHAEPHHFGFDLIKLLAISIRSGKFEIFKLIRGKYNKSLKSQDFLNLAVQHHVNQEFLDYLLEDCGLEEEIDEFDNEFYQSPLHTAIRFNNVEASLKFIITREKFSSLSLRYILIHNRVRLLKILFDTESLLFDCDYRTPDDGNLLHMAAKWANEPEMMRFLLEKCPNILIDELNRHGKTALEISLQFSSPKRQKISEILILNGADVFSYSPKNTCPMETIIASRLVNVFEFCLKIWIERKSKLQFIIDKIFLFRSWSLLDRILLLLSNQDLIIKFEDIPFSEIIKEKANVTLDYLIENNFVELDYVTIDGIVLTGSCEMVKVALKHGVNPEYIIDISEKKWFSGRISETAFESIMSCL